MPRRHKSDPSALRVIPLGGLGEIGKNMLALETSKDIVVIDAGVLFPALEMMGIDVVIPNIRYLLERSDKVRGILITHGHEDHIGALAHLLPDLPAPVYAPPLASTLIRHHLRERRNLGDFDVHVVRPGDVVAFGELEAEWFSVCHSVPDSTGIAIRTPHGTVIHTGDFKIDHDPMLGEPFNYARLGRIVQEGVFLLMSDSTYAEMEGYSDSDRVVAESLFKLIGDCPGRVFVASFASQVARIQIVADSALAHGRKLAVLGRSMTNIVKYARELGHLDLPDELLVTPAEANSLPDDQVMFMTTGSQGEPASALVRMSRGDHQEVRIKPRDTVIVSASPIPGNESAVLAAIDDLVQLGAKVFHSRSHQTHVHGHAQREELRAILNMTKPQYFLPIHGEFRMLKAHADLAIDQGMPEEDVFVLRDGDVLELTHERGRVVDQVPAGHIYVHGLGIWEDEDRVLDERRTISGDGIVTVAIPRNAATGRVIGAPKIASAGFVSREQASKLFKDTVTDLQRQLDRSNGRKLEWDKLEATVRGTVGRFLHKRTRRRPLIIPISVDV